MALTDNAQHLKAWLALYNKTVAHLTSNPYITGIRRGNIITAAIAELVNDAYDDLPAIANLTITAWDNQFVIDFDDVAGATNYVIEMADDATFTTNEEQIYSNTTSGHTETGITPGSTKYFRISATAANKTTSVTTSSSTALAALVASASLTSSAVADTTATLTWEAVTGATGYVLERATDEDFSDASAVYTGANLTFDDTGLSTETQYWYRVYPTAANHNVKNYATETFTTTA